MLNQALTIHDTSDKGKDAEWIHVLLKFLKVYVGDMGKELLMDEESHKAYINKLLDGLKDTASALKTGECYENESPYNLIGENSMEAYRPRAPRSPSIICHY